MSELRAKVQKNIREATKEALAVGLSKEQLFALALFIHAITGATKILQPHEVKEEIWAVWAKMIRSLEDYDDN